MLTYGRLAPALKLGQFCVELSYFTRGLFNFVLFLGAVQRLLAVLQLSAPEFKLTPLLLEGFCILAAQREALLPVLFQGAYLKKGPRTELQL